MKFIFMAVLLSLSLNLTKLLVPRLVIEFTWLEKDKHDHEQRG